MNEQGGKSYGESNLDKQVKLISAAAADALGILSPPLPACHISLVHLDVPPSEVF